MMCNETFPMRSRPVAVVGKVYSVFRTEANPDRGTISSTHQNFLTPDIIVWGKRFEGKDRKIVEWLCQLYRDR